MKIIMIIMLLVTSAVYGISLQKPKIYRNQDISGWVMSEKLDGIRGYWNGKRLVTKKGYAIHAPDYFMRHFPPFALDGELWIRRGAFEEVQSIVLDDHPGNSWKKVTYNIFEVPGAEGNLTQRLHKVKKWFYEHPNRFVKIIPQKRCPDRKALKQYLEEIVQNGGEGVIVKDPSLRYFSGRSGKILKVKKFFDTEAEIIAVNPGKGKYTGMMGSVTVKMKNGTVFNIGTGFSDALRKKRLRIGDVVTFKYYGLTKKNKPRFPSFLRVRASKIY